MSQRSAGPELLRLIELMARLPGFGPRSARRAVLFLLKRKDQILLPLAEALREAGEKIARCETCGNFDTVQPCAICRADGRDDGLICVVEDVPDLWALERGGAFRGRYHVLGGTLSALDAIGPEDLRIPALIQRVIDEQVHEVILALNATVDGQTTAHYISDELAGRCAVTSLAQGVPIGGELDYLDDGTISAALKARKSV